MRPADEHAPHQRRAPTSFSAAVEALSTIDATLRTAHTHRPGQGHDAGLTDSEQALAALLLLRELRTRLAGWEAGLIEAARDAGASWADLARPLGVASRQAAERRYLRVRPGAAGSTGEERVQATRDRRAADRTVTTWARANAAELRQLAGQVTALTDLPTRPHSPVTRLADALGEDDAARLVAPLTDAGTLLQDRHPELAARVDALTDRVDRLRQDSDGRRPAD
ncbi:DUF3156 family protein [Streptomyces chumphonensis]|uniref:Type III effector protein n=1 Tax=Streptomyces chumphonensis TaxID=1214925 RepID=A0A927IET4_9ACTN|nr:type III effector protein [Streptomyces chumphonensis]MBD3934049.1 type III effector protein [Streptomyces chumphonensis]